MRRGGEDSLRRLGLDHIDLLQIHCPPLAVCQSPQVIGILDDFVKAGKIRFYGFSVETVEEALAAINLRAIGS